jgi:peroxiredoxin
MLHIVSQNCYRETVARLTMHKAREAQMTRRPWLLCTAIALALCPWAAVAQQAGGPPAKGRRPSPPLEVRTLDGRSLKVHQMKGKVVLVDFMTTVCPHCKLASADLQKVYQELGPKGFCPVGVALNVDSPAALQEYRQEHGLTFDLGTAPRADVEKYLDHPADKPLMVPTLVLLDRRGRVCSIEVGSKGADALRASVLRLLAE